MTQVRMKSKTTTQKKTQQAQPAPQRPEPRGATGDVAEGFVRVRMIRRRDGDKFQPPLGSVYTRKGERPVFYDYRHNASTDIPKEHFDELLDKGWADLITVVEG